MGINTVLQGSLFTSDFLTQSIQETKDWQNLSDEKLDALQGEIANIFAKFPTNQKPNEQRTEDDLIWKILTALGWDQFMRQQNLTLKGRDDVPDGILFANAEDKAQADGFVEEYKRYQFSKVVVESKRWLRPLDRSANKSNETSAPSTQMLRYLRRADDLTEGKLRWGILTNGSKWRLYFSGARSVSEQFLEVDLAAIFRIEKHGDGLFALDDKEQREALRIFVLMFQRDAFVVLPGELATFHQRALDAGKFYEERVATDLSNKVFDSVFPLIVRAIAEQAEENDLEDVRQAALIFLYRLLFVLYAEDRDLLPVSNSRYADYGLRDRVRMDVKERKDKGDTFSATAARYWNVLDDLSRAIDKGDADIGLPPYNGGLFDPDKTPILSNIRLGDQTIAEVIDRLSFEQRDGERRYINYRDLSVQQLGSIYERLLEHEVVREGPIVDIRPNIFARKGSGSYYTPEDLVKLILTETLEPLIQRCHDNFNNTVKELETSDLHQRKKMQRLYDADVAKSILNLKICDPAMGSGHFLVTLVDYLTDEVLKAIGDTQDTPIDWLPRKKQPYESPVLDEIDAIRFTILDNADAGRWIIDEDQLDDRHIVRRMVLKRCVYGVDKNQMAVELAKVALWLHSFTVGAPLSFLDHHLRNGDSLFGEWVFSGLEKVEKYGDPLMLVQPIKQALETAAQMQEIERLADTEIHEAERSAKIYAGVQTNTAGLDRVLAFVHALDWLNLKDKNDIACVQAFFGREFGDPFRILIDADTLSLKGFVREDAGTKKQMSRYEKIQRFIGIYDRTVALMEEENFFNWQVAFPSIWDNWREHELDGGFDAVVGNPPWDRMKLQQVEWFAARKPEIAKAQRAADRKKMIKALEEANAPLFAAYEKASDRAVTSTKIARSCGSYPLLSGGDINLYSLFVERSMSLIKQDGLIGLLTPSGIASDKTASKFFKGVSTQGRLKALYDFENKKVFFPDVHASFKFCVFVAGKSKQTEPANCAFYLHSVDTLNDPNRKFPLTAEDFAAVNPNTGTAPIFRTRKDAELTTAIYKRLPVLVNHSSGKAVKAWPVKYLRMFDMTNDSNLFRTKQELEEKEGAYPKGGNVYGSSTGDWVPLYVGRMIHQFDHRAASVVTNENNVHNAANSASVSSASKSDPTFFPEPQFWVAASEGHAQRGRNFSIAFRDIARATDARTVIASLVHSVGLGNTAPIIIPEDEEIETPTFCLLLANLNCLILDFIARQKAQSTHLNWYIVEQFPIVLSATYLNGKIGSKQIAEIVGLIVLELTYTAHDMAPFAKDMGYVDDEGNVKPPFVWDDVRRLKLRAKLDAIFFILYGITDRDDVRYIYSTFPIVEKQERTEYGRYRSLELCLAYINALNAGDPDAEIDL